MNIILRAMLNENIGATLLDCVVDDEGNPYAASDIDSIVANCFDLTTNLLVKTTIFAPADVIQPTFSTGAGWSRDGRGWNTSLGFTGDNWPSGDRTYRLRVTYQPTVGEAFDTLYELQCVALLNV